ncbi:MAG TPA: M20 family metallopeptidase [Candidatus Saccharimonadales bacterium]|nr:M20 family metallopeptidase [Candidatus Saccharimonadales bacterium]
MKNEAEKQLAALVGMRSISQDLAVNEATVDYIDTYLKKRGMHCVKNFAGSKATLIASTRPNNGLTPAVMLSAHVDVVPAGDPLFTLRAEGGKLIGRGTFDMKFAVAGYMQLVDDLQASLSDYDFSIVITSDEEIGDHYGLVPLVVAGLRPKICIMPDSTAPDWDVETLAKGYWRFHLIAKGRTGHGARPWEGDSASFKLIDALYELKGHFSEQSQNTDTLNIGILAGGEAFNKIPDGTKAAVEIRFLSEQSLHKNRTIVEAICHKFNLKLEQDSLASPVITDLEHPLVKPYMASVANITGHTPQPFISCAASSAPWLYQVGVTCILSCPEGGGHHSDREWIGRKSFAQFVPILKDYLQSVART